MNTVSVAIATMVLAAAPAVAYAQPFSQAPLLGQIDADHDGKITRQETIAARERVFKRLDRNGDGVVDEKEVETARQAMIERATMAEARLSNQWKRMDQDGDGKVSAPEFQARNLVFELADRNGDGVVTMDEIDFLRGLLGRAG
ncbi:MAG: EF-hand domain-containing protein [Hyphomicrobiales bacterium]|nr:EF-hand domain-containing protein [Hyphomicrobiales bacterium]